MKGPSSIRAIGALSLSSSIFGFSRRVGLWLLSFKEISWRAAIAQISIRYRNPYQRRRLFAAMP